VELTTETQVHPWKLISMIKDNNNDFKTHMTICIYSTVSMRVLAFYKEF
jgi:hypothetical protein